MPKYANAKSGIIAYEISDDSILIEFKGGTKYLYNYNISGKSNVETMKALAKKGSGLNAFIHKNVKHQYIKK